MITPNDIGQRTEEIRFLIGGDNVPQALRRLMDFVRDFSDERDLVNEATIISASYNRVEKAEKQKQLKFGEAQDERTKLLYQALAVVDAIVDTLTAEAA